MRRRFPIRRVLKWVGLVTCVGLFTAWVASPWFPVSYNTGRVFIGAYAGGIDVKLSTKPSLPPYLGWSGPSKPLKFLGFRGLPSVSRYRAVQAVDVQTVYVPLWIPLLLLGLPTAILWHRDRRPPKGHCQNCGYGLTANDSGVCPECGEPTASAS